MYVFIDECGDLGFSPKSTSYFVVAYLVLEYPFDIEIIIKRLLKRLHKSRKYARGANELKFSKSSHYVRRKVLGKICKSNVEIGFVILEKKKVKPRLRQKRNVLYNYVIVNTTMPKILPYLERSGRLSIVVDKSLPRSSREAFNGYAKSKATWIWRFRLGASVKTLRNIEVLHENSQNSSCLQAVDFLAGSCFHKYEFSNNSYYDIIKNKVKHLNYLWR